MCFELVRAKLQTQGELTESAVEFKSCFGVFIRLGLMLGLPFVSNLATIGVRGAKQNICLSFDMENVVLSQMQSFLDERLSLR